LFVKNEPVSSSSTTQSAQDQQVLIDDSAIENDDPTQIININSVRGVNEQTNNDSSGVSLDTMLQNLNQNVKRIVGTLMACFAGVLYAFTFTPALYVQSKYANASQDALDYVFSLYTGIFFSSILYFTLYCVAKKNRPQVYAKIILPGLVSGWMWGIANSCFFLANNALTQVIF